VKRFPDYFVGALAGAVLAFALVFVAGRHGVKTADWMSFYGTLLGSMITIIGAVAVFQLQTDATDRRNLRTITALLNKLGAAGDAMNSAAAALDPAKHVEEARVSYETSLAVAEELKSNGPGISRVAIQLHESTVRTHLNRLLAAIAGGGGINPDDLKARGAEMRKFADDLLARLQNGL
jgi:hypothetical protein